MQPVSGREKVIAKAHTEFADPWQGHKVLNSNRSDDASQADAH